jgi:hypothetical protein
VSCYRDDLGHDSRDVSGRAAAELQRDHAAPARAPVAADLHLSRQVPVPTHRGAPARQVHHPQCRAIADSSVPAAGHHPVTSAEPRSGQWNHPLEIMVNFCILTFVSAQLNYY